MSCKKKIRLQTVRECSVVRQVVNVRKLSEKRIEIGSDEHWTFVDFYRQNTFSGFNIRKFFVLEMKKCCILLVFQNHKLWEVVSC